MSDAFPTSKDEIICDLEEQFNDGEVFDVHTVEALRRLRLQDLFALTKTISMIVRKTRERCKNNTDDDIL